MDKPCVPYANWKKPVVIGHISLWFHLHETSKIKKSIKTESRSVVHRREQWEVTANGYGVSLCGDRNVLELDGGHGYTTLWIY